MYGSNVSACAHMSTTENSRVIKKNSSKNIEKTAIENQCTDKLINTSQSKNNEDNALLKEALHALVNNESKLKMV